MCLALPGCIESTSDRDGLRFGQVRFGTVRREVCLAYVPDAVVGEWVIVHVGFAIQRLNQQAAERAIALLREASEG